MDLSSMLNDSAPKTAASNNSSSMPAKKRDYSMIPPSGSASYHPPRQPNGYRNPDTNLPNNTGTNHSNGANHQAREREAVYQLNASLHYLVTKDASSSQKPTPTPPTSAPGNQNATNGNGLLYSPFKPKVENNQPTSNAPPSGSPKCLRLGPALKENPSLWKPKLRLDTVMKDFPVNQRSARRRLNDQTANTPAIDMEVPLKTQEIILRDDTPKVLLEDSYELLGSYPRGFFIVLAKRCVLHNVIFAYPDHPWFDDLYGLRKSAYIGMRTEDGELYELHLKPSRDKMYLFGYIIKHDDMIRFIKDSMKELFYYQRLPLVLDLDDTLVRLVGEGNDRYVPEVDVPKCRDRVAVLQDGKRVVLAEGVHEFLEWAQGLYEISVCSLGDQTYVENVVKVLDPQGNRIRGILYSARSEHDYIKRSPDPTRPPKDLLALYSFCTLKDKSIGSAFTLPLILDDETRMWPVDQHDNIIEVMAQKSNPVWCVSLLPVVKDTLQYIHQEFFRQYEIWFQKCQEAEQYGYVHTRPPPSAIGIYKTYLRHILRDMIAKPPARS